jgi:ectoine hydroxylase-related dioxygenase (phytanoyl-CoA dioxygenase family)
MKTDNIAEIRSDRAWLNLDACTIDDFAALVDRTTAKADYPFAAEIAENMPVYDRIDILKAAAAPEMRKALLAEWIEAMTDGPGGIVMRGAFADAGAIDAATAHFNAIIAEQHTSGTGGGDHFARPGANDRIWNALEKLCLRDPEVFAAYYGNEIIALVSEAWLGPAYQITSQVNVVNPGGASQTPHRDYHLGFQSGAAVARYPAHVHRLSPVLTLQGAVAHCDMPLESGPTLYLPYSQTYVAGYLATARDEFKRYFAEHHVQVALKKGDAAFFNPALFHAAGNNRSSDIRRMANLLQVSSAFGRSMESVDRARMSKTLYPTLRAMLKAGRIGEAQAANAIAAAAEGYSFPTNLDSDPPIGGMAPETQAALFDRALREDWEPAAFAAAVDAQAAKKRA